MTTDSSPGGRRYDTGHLRTSESDKGGRDTHHEPIAVIGMAGFFPGSSSVEDFCARLDQQESLFIKPPANHLPASAVRERYGAFLADISQFDPEVFKITPLEAEYLDPRQRLLLMSVWHTLEDACYLPEILSRSRTDVYIASEGCPYAPFVHAAEITPYSPTGPSSSSLPNRISHAFKFGGKSLFIDTACSGSLVAVHQAMQALRRNEADYAIVGAANLLFGEEISLAFFGQESLGIVGDIQTCYPFQSNAKGFLPAEGVATVILKRLSDATRDNDNIHALLLGSHVNHAGGTGTLTMPSAEAQSEAIVGAYLDAQIAPWTVTYIEAHGASSILADAAEIQAFISGDRKLQDLFKFESPAASCKISTIKPNIGHGNCVSGLMSLTRVVHSLQHAKKLGIKNFSSCSDRISLEGTRFYINDRTEVWEQLRDDAGLPVPRRAAINNFGAGGVNVHLLIEEFARSPILSIEPAAANAVYFLALSAYRPEELLLRARALSRYVTETGDSISEQDLETLFIASRAAFPIRLVFRYKGLRELLEKLERYVESNGLKGYHLKRDTRVQNDSVELFFKHEQLSAFLSSLAKDTDKGVLFELWSLGIEEPIRNFYKDSLRGCVKRSLPRYAFATEGFWVKPARVSPADRNESRSSFQLSPLLHRNTSDLSEQKYSSVFRGNEFFLEDHVVKGHRFLPGVAYLEMARAAVVDATQKGEGPHGVRLKNIVWRQPIVIDGAPREIHIRLRPVESGRIDFEIYSVSAADKPETVVHCQGSAVPLSAESAPTLDVQSHRGECTEFTIAGAECYRAFKEVGIDYGPSFQGLATIYGKTDQVVGRIALPASLLASQDQFVLHPTIMDSAFQASLGLLAGNSEGGITGLTQAGLPFALQELEVFGPCPRQTWAVVRNSAGSSSASKIRKVDIDLCDDADRICVRMKAFATRPVGGTEMAQEESGAASQAEDLLSTRKLSDQRLAERIEAALEEGILKSLGIIGEALDPTEEFSSFGFDSVSLTVLANELNRAHSLDLNPTLFFEYPTIRRFAAHLAESHREYFAKTFAIALDEAPRNAPQPEHHAPENLREISQVQTRFSFVSQPVQVMSEPSIREPIAIVGMTGRFPMAKDVGEFWQNLATGRDCISEVPPDRWDWKEYFGDPRTEENKTNIKWGGFISGVDEFDPLFFGISPKEAELMDPQQRLLMMFLWNVIEDAGYSAQSLSGTNTGIFVATGASGYGSVITKANIPIEAYTSTGMVPSVGPNRMSYYLNFHGPSEPIETACSSSLVAIHRAVLAIRSGNCDMAIAGGVATILTPDLHVSFSKAGMLCEDGRCKTFSDQANGYVRGEGVGMLFLKKLKDAERADDHIYAVILGTAENHGGRTNSLTAPNPRAQADVVIAAHKDAGVDSRSISYIEAHGTGTGLGDPIEINGLKMAFDAAPAAAWCGVGSVKTNIGHLELSAGVSGVIKVVLQMQHKQLAKNLHCEKVNPYIQLDNSPFYIANEPRDWQPLRDAEGKELPRRAGVSSFGFGGVNAHVILEEYVKPSLYDGVLAGDENAGFAILLSARNSERLQERIQQLYDYLQSDPVKGGDLRIEDIAFTLQLGRDAMEERLALIVESLLELREKLAQVLAGGEKSENILRGRDDRKNSVFSMLKDDDDLRDVVDRWLQRGKVRELSELWVRGMAVDWEKLHRRGDARRVSLPTYPFARQRCWVTPQGNTERAARASGIAIHPVVHHNISTLREQRYTSTFSGEEFFLADHVLRGARILPGVIYLEMARAAVRHATRDSADWEHFRLQKVAWTSPFIVESEPRSIEVVLTPDPDGSISYRILSVDENSEKTWHSRGVAVRASEPESHSLIMEELRKQCTVESFSAQQFYSISERAGGFHYGPGFKTLGHLYKGASQVVATIRLPLQAEKTLAEYVVNPGVMDAALQASMVLLLDLSNDPSRPVGKPALPYLLDELEFLRSISGSMWVFIRPGQAKNSDSGNIRTCDIDVCDDSGAVCVRLKGLSFILLGDDASLGPQAKRSETAVLQPSWKETPHDESLHEPELFREKLLVLCEVDDALSAQIQKRLNADYRVVAFRRPDSEDLSIAERYEESVLRMLEELKQAPAGTGGKRLVQVVVPLVDPEGAAKQQLFCGLTGLLRSAQRENPKLVGQVIEWDPSEGVENLTQKLGKDSRHPEDHRIRYRDGKRWTLQWSAVPKAASPAELPWKDDGVYLITGGAGALGQVFVNEIVAQVRNPTVIITGRHPLEHYALTPLRGWKERGARVEFRQVDISQSGQVAELIQTIKSDFKTLDGILHCAGILRDNPIAAKSANQIREVLSPKVSGLVHLDHATRDLPLDFFVLFSSVAAIVGNAGQSDYAAANGFMDAYAVYRTGLVRQGICNGKTLSINWPLWREGGMLIDAELQAVVRQSTGLMPLDTADGLECFYRAFGSTQSLVVSGKVSQIQRVLLARPARPSTATSSAGQAADAAVLDEIQKTLIATVSAISKVDPATIELDAELTRYGFDSISLIELSDRLNRAHQLELTPAVFFEYSSVRTLASYLLDKYRPVFAGRPVPAQRPAAPAAVAREAPVHVPEEPRGRFFTAERKAERVFPDRSREPIAIVGMSGRFPMSDDIEEFWENLSNARDCISEVPAERWDWKEYFGDPRKDGNKTNVKWGGFMSGLDEFDPLFFGISPKEAELMDPTQRLLMEYVWKAIEDAGYSAQSLSGSRTAILVGTGSSGYHSLASTGDRAIESFTSTGMAVSVGPNRMSYFLNFRGPSEPIETACSSSLIALHRARVLIQNDICDMAVVGGINTMVTPLIHISFSKAGMLCEDGRCKTFSDKANGYVRGEGVGMLVLKRLKDAEEAGDHIYGVILGSAENHGGHATSMTAPNPHAQAEVIRTACSQAGVDPRTIGYVEAHGTGTPLGDPVEINALKSVYKDGGHCGIGSVKSNIGHLELAAGVAGTIKVLLQLQHKRLVKSLHCETINPYIKLEDSPFYILQEARDWQPIQDADGRDLPRRAGISSFGFGGVNAHLVIEEYLQHYPAPEQEQTGKDESFAIVLSAKSPDRLQVMVRNLHEFVERSINSGSKLQIQDLAYTLQVGRDAMDERIGLIVHSLDALRQKLETVSHGIADAEGVYRGTAKRQKDADAPGDLPLWVEQKAYAQILEQWIQGHRVDWSQFYRGVRRQRLSLPTYPFAGEKYWIDTYRRELTGNLPAATRIHPLVHENCSTLQEQRFRSVFSGSEFFLEDHIVDGRHVVPGVVFLEMARAAAKIAIGNTAQELIRIKNVAWSRLLIVDREPRHVVTRLRPSDRGPEIQFEIASSDGSQDEALQIHCQGWVSVSSATVPSVVDLNTLQNACAGESFSAGECYDLLASTGLVINSGHRAIERIHVGDGQVLVRLLLPGKLAGSEPEYGLHPALLDSAVQGVAGFLLSTNPVNRELSIKPGLPFAVEEVEVFAPCETSMWAMLRPAAGGTIQRIGIEMVNDSGQCCVRFHGMAMRSIDGQGSKRPQAGREEAVSSRPEIVEVDETGQPLLVQKSVEYLRTVLSTVIKLPPQRIDVDAPLEKYGIDSLMAVQLTDELEKEFGPLSKTIFFEYQTIRELADFFLQKYRGKLIEVTGVQRPAKAGRAEKREIDSTSQVRSSQRHRFIAERSPAPVPGGQRSEDIAIIGLSGRYPGADSIAEFWRNLSEGRDSITEIPADRWDHSLYFDADKSIPGKTNGKWGGFLNGVDEFDPLFFNISPRDAEYMEPQERLFLQCVYETIEDAGYTRQSLAHYRDAAGLPGNVGVYVGVCYEEYQLYGAEETALGRPIALTGLPSSIANRVSYFFNFHGPSLALDTMCSSSLTALHLACEGLTLGQCDVAVAGGVNVSIHPNKYLMLGQGKFLSSKGQCESFGKGGDGYVPSEGVGAVLLKRLDQAVADGDHIYGVIRGTAINHGGKTNGYTVPNPNAQASVIQRALDAVGVHPRTISYLEAHGTGTSLGDPIEISGLNKVFEKYTQDTQFCAIGSVKSNIGHCESAAGIAGLTKVLLQMQHGQLAPSLHAGTLNEAIDFEASPFVVQQRLEPWRRPLLTLNGERREYPRIAGISSFGAGGSNAHVIVEEYVGEDPGRTPFDAEVPEPLIVLSARSENQLFKVAQNLYDFIGDAGSSDRPVDLLNLAFTLQVGREAMDERVAMVVHSIDDALDKLKRFNRKESAIPGVYRGSAKEKKDVLSLLGSDGDMQETIDRWIHEGKQSKLAALWVDGLSFEWRQVNKAVRPRRMSLPTYPFEKEKYWVPKGEGGSRPILAARSSIHPLLHENTSTFSEQRFTTTFTGREHFLADHRVAGSPVLPGVAYLEMARAGIEQASQIQSDETVAVLRNVLWVRPLVLNGPALRVHLRLSADEDGRIGYEACGEAPAEGGSGVVYSRGTASLRSWTEPPRLEIPKLQARCGSGVVEAAECYSVWSSLGIDYGPAHHGVEKIYVGSGEALAKLRLPEALSKVDQYVLHPSMMDSALQAALFLDRGDLSSLKPSLPFALDELEIFGRSTSVMWAYLRPGAGNTAEGKVRKLDVDVCDESGRLCASFRGLSSRELPAEMTLTAPRSAAPAKTEEQGDTPEGVGRFLLTPVWDIVPKNGTEVFPALSSALVVIGGDESLERIRTQYVDTRRLQIAAQDTIERIAERIRALPALDHLLWIVPASKASGVSDERLITAQGEGVLLGFRLIKALLREGFGGKSLGLTVITRNSQRVLPRDVVNPAHASVHGLIGTLAKEYPAWRIRLLDVEGDRDLPTAEIFAVPPDPEGNSAVFRQGEWYKQQLIQFVPQKTGNT